MEVLFCKYSATGNDFIIIDNRDLSVDTSNVSLWENLCKRRTGVGADGVIFLEKSESRHGKMVYLNSDGKEAEMCGNALRALTHFYCEVLKLSFDQTITFEIQNEVYKIERSGEDFLVEMAFAQDINKFDLSFIDIGRNHYYIDTGVPHVVIEVDNINEIDVYNEGKKIREHKALGARGANVNFYQINKDLSVSIRTYERGVEDETLACGTGVTAVGHTLKSFNTSLPNKVKVQVAGGELILILGEVNIIFGGTVQKIYSGVLTY